MVAQVLSAMKFFKISERSWKVLAGPLETVPTASGKVFNI